MKLERILHPSDKAIAIIIGLGLCLYPVHSKNLTFGSSSDTYVFLPWVGFGLMLIGLICLFDNKWNDFKSNLGPKQIWIPLALIVASAFARVFVDRSMDTVASGALLAVFFGIYVAARKLGIRILWAFLPFVIIESISCIIQGVVDHGYRAGGLLTSFRDVEQTANYDIATCWLILGTCLVLGFNKGIKLRYLVLIAAALYFVAAEEALFALAGLGIAALIRNDISKKVIPIIVVIASCLILGTCFGVTQSIYNETSNKINAVVNDEPSVYGNSMDNATTGRVGVYKEAIKDASILGHGYEPTDFSTRTVHNVPLCIFDQLGIIAALCWIWVTVYCLFKTTWKYVWLSVIFLAVWDHYIFTQAGCWWWAIVGLSLTIPIQDKIFARKEPRVT